MRNFIIVLVVAVLLAGLAGCEEYVGGFESNPLLPSDATPLKNFVGAELSFSVFTEGFPAYLSSIWAQQLNGADRQFTTYVTYTVTRDDFNNDWSTAYAGALGNLRVVQEKAAALGQLNLKGAAEILEGVHMGNVAALWGDVPFSEAIQPPNFKPKFDDQLAVYASVQTKLSQGIADFTSNPVPLAQDALTTGGSNTKWVKLARSAKARYLMHVARSQGYSAAALNAIISEAQQGITAVNGSEDVMTTHGTVQNQSQNLWYDFMTAARTGYMDANATFVLPMLRARRFDGKSNETGRLSFFFNAAQNGLNTTTTGAYAINAGYPIFRASETYLLMAEAYVRLGDASNALTALNNARTYNNTVFKNTSTAFVASDFPTTAALQQAIFNETYLSLMHQIEAFNFMRRINYAISYRDSAGVTQTFTPKKGTTFPQRFLYSTTEGNSNPNCPVEPTDAQFNKTKANR